jgi:acyl dehydratase
MSVAPADVAVGDELPPLDIPMSATRIVACALATRDFMPVHHDRDYAQSQGAPDVFMNIMSTNGHLGRYLTDWAGPSSLVRQLSIRLGAPVFPGSVLRITGTVEGVETVDGGVRATVAVRAATGIGDHATGTAVVDLLA